MLTHKTKCRIGQPIYPQVLSINLSTHDNLHIQFLEEKWKQER